MKRIAFFLLCLSTVFPAFAHKHESDVTVTTDRFTNETEVKLKPFMLGSFKGGYKNNGWLELTASASFPNNQGYFIALVCHAQDWQFLNGVVVHVLADGQKIDLNFRKGSTRVQEDAWTLEILGTFPFVDSTTFDKMANAKVLEMEIGPYAFTFKPAGIQFLKDFSDAVKALPAALASAGAVKAQAPDAAVSDKRQPPILSPSAPGQLPVPGPPSGNSAVAPDATARNGVLLFAYRTHAHARYSKLDEFTSIVDDLISFLKSNGVPVVNDLIHRAVVTEQTTSTDLLVPYLRQIGAQRLLLLTVDTPFAAKLKLILQCYDPGGKLLWEETVRENPFRESTAVAQATLELHKVLGLRMQELRDNEAHNPTPFTVTPPAAVTPEAAARKQFAQTVRDKTVQQLGSQISPGFNITADGPDATIYMYHVRALTYPDCNSMFINKGMISNLQEAGFTQFVCTDDGSTRFAFDLSHGQPTPIQEQPQPVAKTAPGAADTPVAVPTVPERPRPFGFHARMTELEAIAAVGRAAVKAGYPKSMPYGSVLLITTAPKPNSSFEDYALKFSADGLFEVWAHTPGIHSANDGTQVRDEFNDLRKLIAAKYGEPKCFDFRDAGSLERPDFFMMYLKDKEQHLSCTWNVGTHSAGILLEAESLDIDTAIVGVKYQFYPEFERAQAGADEKKADSF